MYVMLQMHAIYFDGLHYWADLAIWLQITPFTYLTIIGTVNCLFV